MLPTIVIARQQTNISKDWLSVCHKASCAIVSTLKAKDNLVR